MALANDVLTAQLQALQSEVQTLGDDLRGALASMNTATENLQASMNQMDAKLKSKLNPLVEADLIENIRAIRKAMRAKLDSWTSRINFMAQTSSNWTLT